MAATPAERWRYHFDNFMARGTVALIGGLAGISVVLLVLAGAFLALTGIHPEGAEPMSFVEGAWGGLMHMLDAGTGGADTGWAFRLVMFGVTLGGIFILSALIGVLNNGLETQLAELRKGRSKVIEEDHTVILGWSPTLFPVIEQLLVANQSRKDACIVILGDRDKVEMEDALRERFGKTHTRLVCRSGNAFDLDELERVSLPTSRSIILLAPEGAENPDAEVIKAVVAVCHHPRRRAGPYHIVAEMAEDAAIEVAKMVGKGELEVVQISPLIARVTAQTCRQSGLSIVYTELLDYDGDEIYFRSEPALVGKTFREALHAYDTSAVIGIHAQGATPKLNPPMDTRIGPGDTLVVVAKDDDTIALGAGPTAIDPSRFRACASVPPGPERTLILGWNRRVPRILHELDSYVSAGSYALVVSDSATAGGVFPSVVADCQQQKVELRAGDTNHRPLLDALTSEPWDHVIVVCSDEISALAADARTLVTLLHLREIANRTGARWSIVSEMLDLRNRALAEVARADDFIVSDRLVSLAIAQVSETKALNGVFADLFDPDGSEAYLRPARDYVETGVEMDFHTVIAAAASRGEVAFGYRLAEHAERADKAYGVVINPDKRARMRFSAEDRLIVLAEA